LLLCILTCPFNFNIVDDFTRPRFDYEKIPVPSINSTLVPGGT